MVNIMASKEIIGTTTAISTVTASEAINCVGVSNAAIQVFGSLTGTGQIEGSNDNSNWGIIGCLSPDGSNKGSFQGNTMGIFQMMAVPKYLRCKILTITSGTPSVQITVYGEKWG